MKRFYITAFCVVCCFVLFWACSKMPSGPAIPEEQKLGVFCALNPEMPAQTIYVSHTLTFQQAMNNDKVYTDVNDAEIVLTGPKGQFRVLDMPDQASANEPSLLNSSDYLSGSNGFNYIGTEQKVQSGETYSISVHSEKYGTLKANTTVPGDFKITNINLDPNYTQEDWFYEIFTRDGDRPDCFRVEWTESENAAGYFVDVSLLLYNVPPAVQHVPFSNFLPRYFPDYTFLNMFYKFQPTNFAVNFKKYFQRGFLTKKNKIEVSLKVFKKMIEFKDDYFYRRNYIKRMLVSVHAVDQAFYNYLAMQFSERYNERLIGLEADIPDISNVIGGVGVFGSYQSQSAICRQFEAVLQQYEEYRDGAIASSNKNEYYSGETNQFIKDIDPKLTLFQSGNELNPGETLRLSWKSTYGDEIYKHFIVMLRPRYLWFSPTSLSYYVHGNSLNVSWEDFPVRDCEVEWAVKALTSKYNGHSDDLCISLSAFKAPELFTNFDFTDWTESSYFSVAPGTILEFESEKPEILNLPVENRFNIDDNLQWSQVTNADGYLIYFTDSSGKETVLFSKTNQIQLGASEPMSCIEGMDWQTSFVSGETCSCRITAIRVKSGALGIYLKSTGVGKPPELSIRRQHPSGIMQQSQWSDVMNLTIE